MFNGRRNMTTTQEKGLFFVLVGPGGAGKDTMMKQIFQKVLDQSIPLYPLVTATTRKPRSGEQDGIDYYFKTIPEFEQMIAQDEVIEHQFVTSGNYYGVPKASVDPILEHGDHVLGDIDVLGAERVLELYPNDALIVFVTVGEENSSDDDRLNILKERMEKRQDKPEAISERLNRAKNLEFPFQKRCHLVIYNTNIEHSTEQLFQFIQEKIAQHQTVK
jgi:guanylate kinase